MLRRLHVQFLSPTPILMAELMSKLEHHRLVASVDLFYPVFTVNTECQDSESTGCELADDRSGVVLEGSAESDR